MSEDQKFIDLKDLNPEEASFEIKGKTYTFRKLSLRDKAWYQRNFGKDATNIFNENNPDVETMLKCVFYQLNNESKAHFLAKDIEEIDPNGEPIKRRKYAWEFFGELIEGARDTELVMTEYIRCMMGSQPILDEIAKMNKKKVKEEDTEEQIGVKSTIE